MINSFFFYFCREATVREESARSGPIIHLRLNVSDTGPDACTMCHEEPRRVLAYVDDSADCARSAHVLHIPAWTYVYAVHMYTYTLRPTHPPTRIDIVA